MQQQWRIKEILEWTTRFFMEKGIEEPRLEAEVLLARVLQKDRVYLYANYEAPVNQEERVSYRGFISRRVNGEPLAYIVGYKEFMSLEFKISPDVLIPRPDTELLVETVIDLARDKGDLRICDVGTGSGAIAVSLAYYLPDSCVYASDICSRALEIARKNAQRHKVDVHFSLGDLLYPLLNEKKFDVITANLPYISPAEYAELEQGVRIYEPGKALLASGDGLDIYRRFLPQACTMLKSGAYLFIEIGSGQGEQALNMGQEFEFSRRQILKDTAGRDRLLVLRKE